MRNAAARRDAPPGSTLDERGWLTLLGGLATEELDASNPAHRDPAFIEAVSPLFDFLRTYYFRAEYQGTEQIPPTGPVIVVGNHSGGPLLPDVWLKLAYWSSVFGTRRPAYALVHDAPFRVPALKNFLVKLGGLRAGMKNAEKVLRRGDVVLIYPGGDLDCLRSFWDRNKVEFFGRTGFIKLAFRLGVPILPVVNVGAHEVFFTLFSSQALARWTGIEKLTRVKTVPLNFGLPWGMWLTGFVPFLPLPSKVIYRVGEPIEFERSPWLAKNDRAVRSAYDTVLGTMQRMVDDLARQRRFPVIG